MRRRSVQIVALGLSLIGYWLPWLTHPAAALRLNGYELSEWVTYLPGVRDGSLPISRLLFLLPLGCLALLLGLAATWQARRPAPLLTAVPSQPAKPATSKGLAGLLPAVQGSAGWGLLLLGLICAFVVFPPYPELLAAYNDPISRTQFIAEYGGQFFAASLSVVILLLALYLPGDVKATLQIILAALGGGVGLWGLLVLRPVASAVLGAPWAVGLGIPLMLLGFSLLALGGLRELFGPRL